MKSVTEYSPYNSRACPKITDTKCKCKIIEIDQLNTLILSDYTANSIFRNTWISFKGCIEQFDIMHIKIKHRNCREMLLDFYKTAYNRTKEMQIRLKEYFSFEKDKECIIKCNVNDLIDAFLVVLSSHANTLQ